MFQEVNHYLHAHNQKQIVMVDPAVAYQPYAPYQRGAEDGIFLRRDNGSFWLGVVWPGVTVFPDCKCPSVVSLPERLVGLDLFFGYHVNIHRVQQGYSKLLEQRVLHILLA